MSIRLIAFFLFCQLGWQHVSAQQKTRLLHGRVLNASNEAVQGVTVSVKNGSQSTLTNDSGFFKINVPDQSQVILVFSHASYYTITQIIEREYNNQASLLIEMRTAPEHLQGVTVTNDRTRREAGLVTLNPGQAIHIPAPGGGIESLVKIIVGSNNELTSNYSVRGGSYDENLIYVNDFEIFRPYLVRNGQQEGLSFINPELTKTVHFYNGGFQARYGDKLSSVLDIEYKRPKKHGGSAYLGLLEQGVHLEGANKSNSFSYLVGARNRTNRNLLSRQETRGNYVPSSADIQALFNWQLSKKNTVEVLLNRSRTRFSLDPQFSQPSTSVFSPLYSSVLGVDIYFDGAERDEYHTTMAGVSFTREVRKNLRLKWLVSYFSNREEESIDITGAYLFGERSFDRRSADFGLITNPLGAGVFQQYARNRLNIDVINLSHKGSYTSGNQTHLWGLSVDRQQVNDRLREFEYQDSAGYSLPANPGELTLFKTLNGDAQFTAHRVSAYWQDNITLNDSANTVLQLGMRVNANDLNNEWLFSPRAGISWKPQQWQKDLVFKGSAGLYMQPPFYRELRRYDGSLNTALKAQKSWQVSGGFDYQFRAFDRPLRLSTEAYYKRMWDVVPYDIDNVRLRYYGENNAKAYATGIEARLFGELVRDAESFISVALMRTREDIKDDFYYTYQFNQQQEPTDSTLVQNGYLRRPTDRLLTVGMFFQDYLSTNKNVKIFINGIYGSNLPYNIPNSVRYRNALYIDPYIRIDLGFSALLLNTEKSKRSSKSPFKHFENIWATLEVFNLIDRANTISYLLIKDFSNSTYAIPNRLTPRLLNIKLIGRW